MRRVLAALALLALACLPAQAATCFWVGGTATWSTANTASWANGTGGSSGTCAATGGVPKNAGDVATFDGASGGGTVTVDSTINGISIATITAGAFTGTLDFSANNPSLTLTTQFNLSGSGTRTINCGSGTFTLSGNNINVWDAGTTTNLTLSCASATIQVNAPSSNNTQIFNGGGKSYGTLSVGARSNGAFLQVGQNNTFSTLSLTGPAKITFQAGGSTTISSAMTVTASASSPVMIESASSSTTLAVPNNTSISSVALRAISFSGTGVTAPNSFNLGGNSNITITAPSSGGGGIIGGG